MTFDDEKTILHSMAQPKENWYGIEIDPPDAADSDAPSEPLDVSKIKKSLLISRIDVGHQLETAADDAIDPRAVERELSDHGIVLQEIPPEEMEKFGMGVDHPLHKEHMANAS